MRIAFDCRSVYKGAGGIGTYTLSLLEEFRLIGGRHEFACYFSDFELELPSLPPNFTVSRFQAFMIDQRFDQKLPSLLETDRIDLYFNPTFGIPPAKTHARYVSTIHDVVFRRHPEYVDPHIRRYLDNATQHATQHADALITVSEYSKTEIVELYSVDADRITVIHNGVWVPERTPRDSILPTGLVPRGYALYVGSIEPKKGIDLLLHAFRQVPPPTRLVIAGLPNLRAFPLEARIEELGLEGRVSMLGYVSPELLEELYRNAAVFVYPSLYEGFGLPPLEAMARGVPTIVSDATSLPEVVGDGALQFPRESAEAFSGAIRHLLEDESACRELSVRGKRRAEAFSWKRSAEQHLHLFERVASSG